jgi:hypothetical protein
MYLINFWQKSSLMSKCEIVQGPGLEDRMMEEVKWKMDDRNKSR